jgi:opacity protein-like surface antigen
MGSLRTLAVSGAALALVLIAPAGAVAQGWGDSFLRGSVDRWDGWNFGVHVGMSNLNTEFGNSASSEIAYILRNTTLESEAAPSNWTTLPSDTTNGRNYGAFLGYSAQWEQLVIGFDLAYNRPSTLEGSASDSIARILTTSDGVTHDVLITAQSSIKLVDYATLRARAGYTFGRFLPYAFVGAAAGRFNYTTSATVTDVWTPSAGPPSVQFGPITQSDGKDNAVVGGFTTGLGLDVALLANVYLRSEWEFVAFAPVNAIRTNINTGRVGVGVKF